MAYLSIPMGVLLQLQLPVHHGKSLKIASYERNIVSSE